MVALRKLDEVSGAISLEAPPAATFGLADGQKRSTPSPARNLLGRVRSAYADEPAVGKWPARYRVAMIVVAPTALWGLIGFFVYQLLKH
jgi:hypothetical protein